MKRLPFGTGDYIITLLVFAIEFTIAIHPKQHSGHNSMYQLASLTLIFFLLASTQAVYGQTQQLQDVLDRLVETYGGEENLTKLNSMTQRWNMVALIRNQTGTDFRKIKAPDQLRVELTYPDKSETRMINRDGAHVVFEGGLPQQVTGMQRDAMRLQQMRLYSPLMLKTKIESMNLIEEGDQLALSLVEDGLHVFYMVNKSTWRIEKVAGTLMMNGSEIKFLTILSDFSYIDGVLIHRKEDKYAGGMNTASLQLRDITFNAELEDSMFQP
jgi:outer membrane lipoprotein-sorting protein